MLRVVFKTLPFNSTEVNISSKQFLMRNKLGHYNVELLWHVLKMKQTILFKYFVFQEVKKMHPKIAYLVILSYMLLKKFSFY